MAFMKRTLDQIKSMLGSLAFSQKMLIVTLLIIIVASVAWMMSYAGKPEMVPVINQQFQPDVLARQSAALKAAGIKSEIKDGRVMVPADKQEQALATLAYSGELAGQDISFGFEQIVNDSNMWRSEADKERNWQVGVQNVLASRIRLFPGVGDATVIISQPQKNTFGKTDNSGSAAVHLRMKAGSAIDNKMVIAVADWVGSASRIPREKIKVIDSTSGRSYSVPGEESAVSANMLENAHHEEEIKARKIRELLGIDNLLVSVSVKVDATTSSTKDILPDRSKTITPVVEESSIKSSSTDSGSAGEPGVVTNTPTAVPAAAVSGGGTHRSESEDKTTFGPPIVASKETVTTRLPGEVQVVSAAVNVPRSWFVTAMKASGAADADGEPLKQFITEQLAQIKEQVLRAIGLDKDAADRVVVAWYPDAVPAGDAGGAKAEGPGLLASVGLHARTIGLGALAVVSLLAMVLLMRKAASGVTITASEPVLAGATAGGGASGPAGSSSPRPTLDITDDEEPMNVEVDKDTRRTQKMVEQVAGMVKQNPDIAANLVKRWVSKKQK